jgi:hypothetical protein
MPELHDADVEMHWRCAGYRFRYGEWPTRLELGPHALRALKRVLSAESFARLGELFEVVTLASRSDDVRSQLEMRFSGAAGAVSDAEGYLPILKTKEKGDQWEKCLLETRASLLNEITAGASDWRRADCPR